MSSPDLDAAERFLAAHARVLEWQRFDRLRHGGGPDAVRAAVAAYRNPDGGFGHALEPDGRSPGTQPLAIEFALHILDEADAWDDGLAEGACGWLDGHAPAEGGAVFVDPGIEAWPHAPWWVPEDGGPASLITTGLLAATLHRRQVRHPWLDRATELLWARVGGMTTTSPYDMRAVLSFLDQVPDRARAQQAFDRIGPMIFDRGLVTLDPGAPGEIHTPLDFAPLPGSLARGLFDKPVIEAHLDHLGAAQQADGSWTFNWLAWSPAAEREWRGVMTVNALHLLRANGRW
jgi:hypothetical protein